MALNQTWEKILEYASSPVQGTLSRKQRKGLKLQINEGKIFENATLFLGEEFIRITEQKDKEAVNAYYDWDKVYTIVTMSKIEE